jgi:diguanylate cyclase (GGDEF)-like protein
MLTEDTVARTGGDVFVVVLSQLSDPKYSDLVARRIVESVSAPYRIDGKEVRISTSVGLAVYGRAGTSAEALLKAGDEDLYRAKQRRRGRGGP